VPTQITLTDVTGSDKTILVNDPIPIVTRKVNDGIKNGDQFVSFEGQDGKGFTVHPEEVTDIREV
jgi:hypothetical protein